MLKNLFGNKPSFLLLMSDGKEYISCGCVFEEYTKENIEDLVQSFGCKEKIWELIKSSVLENYDSIINASYMFHRCESLTKVVLTLPNTKIALGMFKNCEKLNDVVLQTPNLEKATAMFYSCVDLTEIYLKTLRLENARSMFAWCDKLKKVTVGILHFCHGKHTFQGCFLLKEENITNLFYKNKLTG